MERAFGPQFTCGLIAPKEKSAANGDYNLSGERYREGGAHGTTNRLGDQEEGFMVAPN